MLNDGLLQPFGETARDPTTADAARCSRLRRLRPSTKSRPVRRAAVDRDEAAENDSGSKSHRGTHQWQRRTAPTRFFFFFFFFFFLPLDDGRVATDCTRSARERGMIFSTAPARSRSRKRRSRMPPVFPARRRDAGRTSRVAQCATIASALISWNTCARPETLGLSPEQRAQSFSPSRSSMYEQELVDDARSFFQLADFSACRGRRVGGSTSFADVDAERAPLLLVFSGCRRALRRSRMMTTLDSTMKRSPR